MPLNRREFMETWLPEECLAELRAEIGRDKEASVLEAWHSFQQAERM